MKTEPSPPHTSTSTESRSTIKMPKAAKKIPTLAGYEENLPYTGTTKDKARLITYECRRALINYYANHNLTYEDYEKEILARIAKNDRTVLTIARLRNYCYLGTALRNEMTNTITKPSKLRSDHTRAISFLSEIFEK